MRATWPGAFDPTRIITDHGLENSQPRSSGQDACLDDFADHGHVHAHTGARNTRYCAGVLISARNMVEKIARASNSQIIELLRAARPHTLQELDGLIEKRAHQRARHQAARTSRAKRAGSNTSRSSILSPVPTTFTGKSNSCLSDTTIPPRAELSSLASAMPVSGSVWRNVRTWATAFCPTVASNTMRVS